MPVIDTIANTVQINASAEAGVAVMGTSMTIRNGWGRARILGAVALGDTDDITRSVITCPSWSDANGVSVPVVSCVATDLPHLKLEDYVFPVPIPVQPSDVLTHTHTSETAANTQAMGLIWVEYEKAGQDWPKAGDGAKAMVCRNFTAGGALVSLTDTIQTAFTTLAANKTYQVIGVKSNGIAAGTAGIVGPCFIGFYAGPGEFGGSQLIVPLPRGLDTGCPNMIDLIKAGFRSPKFKGGQDVAWKLYGFTAEQPQGELILAVDQP